ncbi:CocE/NonD family hydrolase [Streptomyces sp. NBC_00536]|uniref:CocE/NonD family hydrolase n=1 Tax=Streptomyces sp. NBC_00536 TaxID=2975769 RepID=UPI002E823D54|nr:CocE/NonD family hydrolase [Streptomyces sp. NBC_00536]WUC82959.1 CocE/NonD family hydrolase [Streptomyces sp. NBC_00536]
MNASQDDSARPLTPAQLAQVADSGIWASSTTVNQDAANVGQALVATLQGNAAQGVLTPELQKLVADVQRVATVGFPRIVAEDGTRLSAHTIRLNTAEPRPLVIVPSGWTPFGWVLFEYAHLQLALRGYHVLAYTPRGLGLTTQTPSGAYIDAFWTSGGTIDVAGPLDRSDGSSVIDYAEEFFQPTSIGFLGESYGSGISQLVAAHDPRERVKAVVALSTWGNLATSLLHHDTRHLQAVTSLVNFTGGPVERKFDEATRQILQDFDLGQNLDGVRDWGWERAPERYLEDTNGREIPTFFSNTWHETLFPVNQVLETFNQLTVPKRLNMWIGDHAAPEGAGLTIPLSGPNTPVAEAFAWLDHHLLEVQNDVPNWSPVSNQVMFTYLTEPDPGTGQNVITRPAVREQVQSWDELTTRVERWYLADSADGGQDGALTAALAPAPNPGRQREFFAGSLTEATAVDAVMTTGQAEWKGNPKIYETEKFNRQKLLVWSTEPLAATAEGGSGRRVRGIPRVHLTVRSTAASATLVAYLFDIDPDGNTARIIAHEPYTLTALTPDQDTTVDWPLQAAAYDLPDGHRLALVVNSRDQLYSHAGVEGSTTTISSSDTDPSYLDLPLG